MVYVLALAAAFSNALTSVLQRMGVEYAPPEDRMRLRLITHALRQPVWLAGFGLMIASFVFQATALHLGRLTVVQPLLTTELLFLVLILGARFQFTVGWREWLGAAAAAGGLAGFLVFASPRGGDLIPGNLEWLVMGLSCLAVIAIGVVAARRGPRWWRGAAYGVAAAVAYAFTAALTKVVSDFFATDWLSIFRHWQTYGLAGFGVLAVFLTQNAYHAGPIAASQSAIVLVDPLASIIIGVNLFGDDLRTAGAWGPLEALSLLVLFVGAIALCTSPLVNPSKVGGAESAEILTTRYRPKHGPDAGDPALGLPNT
jgi:drug/metabolite transporter (DMT)-like permease